MLILELFKSYSTYKKVTIQMKKIEQTVDPSRIKLKDDFFNRLAKLNEQTVGWIHILGTNIDYPFVQTSDNNYYLTHSYDKSYSEAGWVFLDYRNSKNLSDQNTILYAHGRKDGTMFGSLKNVLNYNWYSNFKNHIIEVTTLKGKSKWQVFSTYIINNEQYYLTTFFKDKKSFDNFIEVIKNRSIYNYNVNLNTNDKILTLSTCYSNNKRVVVHAKLISL